MPREPYERGPQWDTIGEQIVEARNRLGMSQAALARHVNCAQTIVSRDEHGNGFPESRLQAYCALFRWDVDKIKAFLNGTMELPVEERARRDYKELFELLDGKLLDGEEQDLIDEALQLVILHRYPDVTVEDFVAPKVVDEGAGGVDP